MKRNYGSILFREYMQRYEKVICISIMHVLVHFMFALLFPEKMK